MYLDITVEGECQGQCSMRDVICSGCSSLSSGRVGGLRLAAVLTVVFDSLQVQALVASWR